MYILKCEAFDGELGLRHPNRCCSGNGSCHEQNTLIPVTPYALDATLENRRLDWELGIQGLVCCGRYEFVRALSREWWVFKGKEIGLWGEFEARQFMHKGSWHVSFDNSSPSLSGRDESSRRRSVDKTRGTGYNSSRCPSCGKPWSGDACENCGHGGIGL